MSEKTREGLPALDPGALHHPVGLDVVPVGPRIFVSACVIVAIALAPTMRVLVANTAVLLAVAGLLGVLLPVLKAWRTIVPVSASLLIVYAWAYPGSTEYIWIFGVQSFLVGLFIVLRLVGFVTALYLLLVATGPLAIVRWAGDVHEDLGIMTSLTLGVLPAMKQQMDTTLQAQQARGLQVGGSLVRKVRAYLAVIVPVVVKSLVRAYGMAALMHVRGYGSGRRVRTPRRFTAPVAATYLVGVVWVAIGVATQVMA